MLEDIGDSSCSLDSDDLNASDYFTSSPSSHSSFTHRFTSPGQEEHQDICSDEFESVVLFRKRNLPIELIEYILELFFRQYPSFRSIRPFSEANSQFRKVALRRYMISLRIDSARQLVSLERVHRSILSRSDSWGSAGFNWIKSTQKNRLRQIFDVPLMNAPMVHLTTLTLTDLWRIDAVLLGIISKVFPGLTSLHLSCSEHLDVSCCWPCFEESASAVVHSPIPNHFSSVLKLSTDFAKALKPLTKLANLHLGIFLSDEEMLENHLEHYDSPRAYERILRTTFGRKHIGAHTGTMLSQSASPSIGHSENVSYTEDEEDPDKAPATPPDELPPFPHGPDLCPICSILVSAPEVQTRELEASLSFARKLKTLETISWSSFFAWKRPPPDEKKIGDWRRMTKAYVLRADGRVRVRRRPWY
ncbi:hypothetical protein BU15DRAFT_42406 [Melanogaster broomeanus]|nr:hypothetical protein BU15DRAFT_42406 [Melanogaster broomeanus]